MVPPRAPAGDFGGRSRELLERRTEANRRFFAAEAGRIARLCHRMAEHFARGGRLLAIAVSPAARSDARHVAVEFVHPVIVGKRALPALALTSDDLERQLELLLRPVDMVIAFGEEDALAGGIVNARRKGALTVDFVSHGAEWSFHSPDDDPFIAQELVETLYHVLWELVHIFFEHPGLLKGGGARQVHDSGASSFLYPFLAQTEEGVEAVLADVEHSVRLKADEIGELRRQTLTENSGVLSAAATDLRGVFADGGKLLALGSGGSATDAMDAVADFRTPPSRYRWTPRAALDLTEDAAILTAIANDIGTDALFSRQIIAYGQQGDAVLALSTSGDSRNVIAALAEARRRGLRTVAMVGYDGGRVAEEGLADHVIVSRSEHIPRIQEAQASAYHALREFVEIA